MLESTNNILTLIGGIGGLFGLIAAVIVAWNNFEFILAHRLANKVDKSKLTQQCQLYITISTVEELKEVLDALVTKKTVISLKPPHENTPTHNHTKTHPPRSEQ